MVVTIWLAVAVFVAAWSQHEALQRYEIKVLGKWPTIAMSAWVGFLWPLLPLVAAWAWIYSWRHRTAQQVAESALRRANKGANPRHVQ